MRLTDLYLQRSIRFELLIMRFWRHKRNAHRELDSWPQIYRNGGFLDAAHRVCSCRFQLVLQLQNLFLRFLKKKISAVDFVSFYFYRAHEFAVRVVFEVVVRLSPVKVAERARAFSRKNKLVQVVLELRVFYCRCAESNVCIEIC